MLCSKSLLATVASATGFDWGGVSYVRELVLVWVDGLVFVERALAGCEGETGPYEEGGLRELE